ncbi:sqs1 [Metarhizium brunneum]
MARSKKSGRPWKGGKSLSTKRSEARSHSGLPENHHAMLAISTAAITLVEEARQTSLHDHGLWNEHAQLRKNPVHFVSAGRTDPLNDHPTKEESSESNSNDKETMLKLSLETQDGMRSSDLVLHNSPTQNYDKFNEEGSQTFHLDIIEDKTTKNSHCSHAVVSNQPSSPDSSSSEEVILFRGRREREGHGFKAKEMLREQEVHHTTESKPPSLSADEDYLSTDYLQSSRSRKRGRRKGHTQYETGDEDIVADYINNMRDSGELDCLFDEIGGNQRELGARDTEVVFSCSDSDTKHNRPQDTNRAAGSQAPQHKKHYFKSIEDTWRHTEDPEDEDALVDLIAAQDLSSSSDVAADTQTPESNLPDTRPARRYGANKQEEFDFMDWSTAHIRSKKGKGYRTQVPFNNDDSDLELQLQVAWKSDRMRKKERKRQREELRSLGMLQKNAKPDDLRTKYPSGMSIEQVGEEIERFLHSGNEVYEPLERISYYGNKANADSIFTSRLSFPPMDLHARKLIHELANKFNIKSKSTGKADQRRPTLYRTIRTLPYAEIPFQNALRQIQRRFLPRLDTKGKRNSKLSTTRGQTLGAAGYREGEVVGASAPELGVDNRGRAMLERMGWSCGTALGSIDNKGILQPVTQTMKKSKAGLG